MGWPSIGGFFLGAVLALQTSLAHAATELRPGLWSIITTRDLANGNKSQLTQVRCLSPDLVKHVDQAFGAGVAKVSASCQVLASGATNSGFAWRARCGGEFGTTATANYSFDSPEHFSVLVKLLSARPRVIKTILAEGRRIGECSK